MANRPSAPEPQLTEATWRELDDVIDAIARLARSEESPNRFYSSLLERIISALSAAGGAIWTRDAGGNLLQECLVNPPQPWSCQNLNEIAGHGELIERVAASGEPRLFPPGRKSSPADPAANPTDTLLILVPWQVDRASAGLIELFQRPGAGPAAEHGYLEFLEVVSEFVAEFHRNCQLRQFKQIARDWSRFDQFARQVHAGLDLSRTAYAIVNEGRRLLECDRVSLCVRRGRRFRLTAVSGVDAPNRRAELNRRMEKLCKAAARGGEPLWFPSESSELPPPLEKPLNEYLDECHARSLGVLPLLPETPAAGPPTAVLPPAVLVVEKFFGTFAKSERVMVAEAGVHAHSALRNCLELQSVPFASALRRLRWLSDARRWLKGALAVGVVAAIVAAAVMLKADFTVVADGDMEPARLRDVFARADGTVNNLCVEHGQHVRAGDLLAVLRRPQLDLEFKQVLGELQTAQQKLVSLEAERLQVSRDSDEQRRRYDQATAQEEELRETVRGLQAQYVVLKSKQSECEVRSPIEGDVLTWNVRQLLEDRPVGRGQVLLTVGDLSGPWKVDLRIPDRQAGHVLAAQDAQPESPLQVSCLLAMNPRQSFPGTLARMGMRSETSASESPYVEASVDIDRSAVQQCTAGAGVRAYIGCGRRSLGYVWLHDLYDTVRMWLFF
jgi:multidrug efflux pump subunit AcrA (membrane-fusion protein)